MKRELLSERFVLRLLGPSDLLTLHRLWTDKGVRQFLWDNEVIPIEQTEGVLEKNERLFHDSGFGIWGVREHKSPELIGFAGFWHFRTPPSLELLFGVAQDHWNRGVATEASSSVIRYGFEILNFDTIEASTDFANNASIRVLEKLSMTLRQRASVNGLDTLFYGLTRDEWLKVDSLTNLSNGFRFRRRTQICDFL